MRIALVNDLVLALEALKRVVLSVPGYTVAWTARDGREAAQKCLTDPPDLILMDLIMPVMDGAESTREIMANSPCPILVVTASVSINAEKVYEAMGYGALDATRTPTLGPGGQLDGAASLLAKINRVAVLSGKVQARRDTRFGLTPPPCFPDTPKVSLPPLLAIGSSTGGPQALATILSALPRPFPAAIAIVQHVDSEFADGLAHWLAQRSGFEVEAARVGETFVAGKVVIAATADHLVVNCAGQINYTPEPRDLVYRPSVDVFFRSLSASWPNPGVAVLLTGMGRDGAIGLKLLRDHRWHTIAQGQKSCIVYGMPKAAAELGAASQILDLTDIAPAILTQFQFHPTGA